MTPNDTLQTNGQTNGITALPEGTPGVDGSFEQPPVVLRQSRARLILVCLGVVVMGILLAEKPMRAHSAADTPLWHHVLLGLVALGAVLAALQAMSPATLTLDPSGLVKRTVFRTRRYQWNDFARFRWYRTRGGKIVAGDHSDAYRASRGWTGALRRWVTLGGGWQLPPQRVVDVLNEALRRWGPRP